MNTNQRQLPALPCIVFALLLLGALVASRIQYHRAITQTQPESGLMSEITNEVKVGQLWIYKSSSPFRENNVPSTKLVLAVTNGHVQYLFNGAITSSAPVWLFTTDSYLQTP